MCIVRGESFGLFWFGWFLRPRQQLGYLVDGSQDWPLTVLSVATQRQSGETMTSVSTGHFILTWTPNTHTHTLSVYLFLFLSLTDWIELSLSDCLVCLSVCLSLSLSLSLALSLSLSLSRTLSLSLSVSPPSNPLPLSHNRYAHLSGRIQFLSACPLFRPYLRTLVLDKKKTREKTSILCLPPRHLLLPPPFL